MAACSANGPGPATKRLFHQRQRLGNLVAIPAAAILLFENHDIACLIDTGIAPGVLQQHEREQGGSLCRRLASSQRSDQAAQPNRLGA